MTASEVIVFDEVPAAGGFTIAFAMLDAPKSLNALSQAMIDALSERLAQWRARSDVACVVLYGAGERAFCAGGDVVGLYHAMREADGQPSRDAEKFFETEYRLDYAIHTYPKPMLCWGHGTVMGGGLGLLAGASYRVVTESSLIAMPEITIGLFPDVGATWFLNRMLGRSGLYLALTATPMNAGDALLTGLADFFLRDDDCEQVLAALPEVAWSGDARADGGALARCLRGFADDARASLPASEVLAHQDTIAHLTDSGSVAGIQAALTDTVHDTAWVQRGADAIARGSPMSLSVIVEQLASGRHLSLKQVFAREFCMAVQCTRHPDLTEGVRALLIDKDRRPHWTPPRLDQVSDAYVAEHFELPSGYPKNPLDDL